MNKPSFFFLFFIYGLLGSQLYLAYSQDSIDSLRYYHSIILKPETSSELNSAFLFFERGIQKQLSKGDTISAVQNLRRVAIGQYELGFLYESEATAVQALKLLENQKVDAISREAKSGLLNHLGIVYRRLKLYDKALTYYKIALESAVDATDSISTINNISNVYLDKNKYELALSNVSLVLKKRLLQNDSIGIARALDNLGFVQSKLNMSEALNNMEYALKIRQRNYDLFGQYSSYHHLSKYYLKQGDRKKAVEHADLAYDIAKHLNSSTYIENALSLLLDFSEDPKVIAYRKLTDSISSAKQVQENKYAMVKYNVEKERQKAQAAEIQNEREKTYKIIFISAFILAIMVGTFVVYRKNQQRKRELVQTAQKTEARISKRVHDDLANDVSGVMTFVEHKLNIPVKTKERLLYFLNDIYVRSRDISVANAGVNVSDFPTALKNLIAQYHPKGVNIVTSPYSNIGWDKVPEHKKIQLYKCLQELLVNTKKHSRATLISIAFNEKGRKNSIVYSDNGIGFDTDKILMGGMKNVETRMTEIGGSFSFESNIGKGFKGILLF